MTTYVYILRERGSTIARYVGQSGYPEYRFIQHRRTAGNMPKPTAFAEWLLTADVEWVELTGYPTAAEARKAERDLITALITLGHPLFNLHGVPIEQRAPRYAMPARKPRRRYERSGGGMSEFTRPKCGSHNEQIHCNTFVNTHIQGWRPIATAPQDGEWFWAFWPVHTVEDQQHVTCWMPCNVHDEPAFVTAADSIDWCQPTHWMPLPEAPVA